MLQTNKQTDKQTDSNILPTPTDRVGVGNEEVLSSKKGDATICVGYTESQGTEPGHTLRLPEARPASV